MLKKVLKFIISYTKNMRSDYYLKKKSQSNVNRVVMRVGFIVFEPETWDKLNALYFSLKNTVGIEVQLVVVPNFDRNFKITTQYGDELDFFKSIDNSAIPAYTDKRRWIDLKKLEFDYVFYQDPYNAHMPKKLSSNYAVKITKICYLSYGFSISNNFNGGNTNSDFFRNVSFTFCDVPEIKGILELKFKKNVIRKIQHFYDYGYPSLADYAQITPRKEIKCLGWTPRWSYDPIIGGSHFLEFKDEFVAFAKENPNLRIIFRPHPMMFLNLINNKLISKESVDEFIGKLADLGVIYSKGKSLYEDLYDIDLLITDFSSIIPAFFITSKPMIYCTSTIPFNDSFKSYINSIYKANTWADVSKLIKNIKEGNDPLLDVRSNHAAIFKEKHMRACDKIVNELLKDFENCRAN